MLVNIFHTIIWEGMFFHGCFLKACGPITNVPASNWRNVEFSKWLHSQLGDEAKQLRQVDANEYFVERYDLHTPPDSGIFLNLAYGFLP